MISLQDEIRANDLERICRDYFGIATPVTSIIASDVLAGEDTFATIFETDRQETYALFTSNTPQSLGDITRAVKHMGLRAAKFLQPAHNSNYFGDYGREAFKAAFPGRRLNQNDDLSYYISLCPYTPALVQIDRIESEIRQYVPVVARWHKLLDYSYSRIEVR